MKNNKELTSQQKKLLNIRKRLARSGNSEKILAENFLELMFPNDLEKAVYTRRYYNVPDSEFLQSVERDNKKNIGFRKIEEETR